MNHNTWSYTFNPGEELVFTSDKPEKARVLAKPILPVEVKVVELFDQDAPDDFQPAMPALEIDTIMLEQAHSALIVQGQERRDFGHLQGQAS